ncbi:GAF and ANTAR domain-containing protein [Kribbella sp. NPDC051620]|uniref:GAF and ANTAR domain-containing protein n=1 Tax=Kribbella sp. NPDC051620 TaxID=3364120 RepID=UPI0037878E8F
MTTPDDPAREGRAATALHELALAASTLTGDHDVIGATTSLLVGCVRATGAAAAGLVMERPVDRRLELLASTSHRAEELELYQLQVDEGPCVDSVKQAEPVAVDGTEQLAARWPALSPACQRAGFDAVHAAPLIWQGAALGAINLFFAGGLPDDEIGEIAQMFADLATIAVVHSGRLSAQDVIERSRVALDERIVIERAKGVLAYTEDVPVDEAFDILLALAAERGRPLGEVAVQVIDEAYNGRVHD